jgi:hypothetical protein
MTLRVRFSMLAGMALAGSLLLGASPAVAQSCQPGGHSGNSETGQYSEQVPGACGDQNLPGGSNSSGQSGSSGSGSAVPPALLHQLQALGPAGIQTAKYAQATALPSSGHGGQGEQGGSPGSDTNGGSAASAIGAGKVLSAIGDLLSGGSSDQGIGALLPILLATALLGGMTVFALRRRRAS